MLSLARTIAFCAALVLAFVQDSGARWSEEDFAASRVRPIRIEASVADPARSVVGQRESYTVRKGDTLWDIARHFDLGIGELREAFPDLDLWVPETGRHLRIPTLWILPAAKSSGLVINIPEMRLYYFPPASGDERVVITHPVGLGRDDWQTPIGKFRITEKSVDPKWVIPEGIRAERIRTKGKRDTAIAGGAPDNPLGRYRMRLSIPTYGIHGTNIPWGVGMRVSHGCIRLYPEDIDQLFPVVPVGTVGEFTYEPVKIGVRRGQIYIEVHTDIYDRGFDFWNESIALLEARGWAEHVELDRLMNAIDRKSGVPTRISRGRPLRIAHQD